MGARRDDITAAQRMQISIVMLNPERARGEASRLAQAYGVARKTVYDIADRAEEVLLNGLEPGPHGPEVAERVIRVNRNRLVRSTVKLTEAQVSQREIASCLAEILDTPVSPSWVNARLAELEAAAAAVNAEWQPAVGEGLAGDELFAYGQPQLLVVGNESLFIYALTAQAHRDGATWGGVLVALPDSPQFASDAGTGLAVGVAAAGYAHQLDWDHRLRPLWHQAAQLERRAYAKLAALEERARQFEQAPTEKRLQQHLRQWEKLDAAAEEAITRYDQFETLARKVDAEFAMIDLTTGQLRDPETSRARLEALGAPIQALPGRACHKLGTDLINWAQGLVSYLPRLADALTPLIQAFGQPAIQALSRLWQVEADLQRGHLAPSQRQTREHIWHTSLDEAAHRLAEQPLFVAFDALAACLGRIWRGSMAAECVNSWLRPWLDGRKHADQGTLELFRFLHNTHTFDRGKRAGSSPAELVGILLPDDRFTLLGLDPKC